MSSREDVAAIHVDIVACQLCDAGGLAVEHPTRMERGSGRHILVVGIEPGRTELASGISFSGPGGRRLMNWLRSAGLGDTPEEIRRNAYLTSLCKCRVVDKRQFNHVVRNCFPFLVRQISALEPRVCVTL